MKKYSFKRYAGVTMALFGAAALSLLLFFALFRIDAIHKAFSHICKTLMPFIIGGVVQYVISSIIYIIRYLSLLRMRRKRKACPIILVCLQGFL
jgi:hypothetical protein